MRRYLIGHPYIFVDHAYADFRQSGGRCAICVMITADTPAGG
jgi:hypothetical protein